ncbi:MAG: ParB N-terminal domain-containing protein [Bacteroidetes bacterium]|jgi:ParB-like chromosome segregation protein Spo0J|nr:ParB N-terminal domain-containing protein [Bacteroidota bacterium]
MELFDEQIDAARKQAEDLAATIDRLPMPQKAHALNTAREALHEISPFREHPVDFVRWIEIEQVEGNDYNPNTVAPPEMRLLKRSIEADGYTQPVVTWTEDGEAFEVVDGEHRSEIPRRYNRVRRSTHGHLPVTVVKDEQADRKNRIAATIRHNRARGVHGVAPMTDIVEDLVRLGWADEAIASELGMDADEVIRFKQNSGLPEIFRDEDYSRAWK